MTILKNFLKKNKAIKLENFLIKNEASRSDLFNYAKDMTLKEFYNKCEMGERIIWIFARTNPSNVKELVLTAAHCANACRHFLKDERSLRAIDAALNFESYSKEELEKIRIAAWDANRTARRDAAAAAANLAEAAEAAVAYYDARAAEVAEVAARAAEHVACYAYPTAWNAAYALGDEKLIANIVKKHLPLEMWNQEIINN